MSDTEEKICLFSKEWILEQVKTECKINPECEIEIKNMQNEFGEIIQRFLKRYHENERDTNNAEQIKGIVKSLI
jgi:hypothetical protein